MKGIQEPGKADWIYDKEFDFWIPCCTVAVEHEAKWINGSEVFFETKRCGNGPLTGIAIFYGDCGEHSLTDGTGDAKRMHPHVIDLIRRLAKIGDEEYLTWTWAGSPCCVWCSVAYPKSWDDHDSDCPGKLAREALAPELLITERNEDNS